MRNFKEKVKCLNCKLQRVPLSGSTLGKYHLIPDITVILRKISYHQAMLWAAGQIQAETTRAFIFRACGKHQRG